MDLSRLWFPTAADESKFLVAYRKELSAGHCYHHRREIFAQKTNNNNKIACFVLQQKKKKTQNFPSYGSMICHCLRYCVLEALERLFSVTANCCSAADNDIWTMREKVLPEISHWTSKFGVLSWEIFFLFLSFSKASLTAQYKSPIHFHNNYPAKFC